MKNKLWIALLLASLGVNAGLLLHWLRPQAAAVKSAAISPGWHAGPMKKHLGLSADQSRRMESERRQVLAQAKPLQDELRRKRRELFMLLKGKDVRDSDLDAILGEIARLQAAIEKAFILHSLKTRSVFTPAQLSKYEGFLEQGLCPGMLAETPCSSGKMSGRGPGNTGCDNGQNE